MNNVTEPEPQVLSKSPKVLMFAMEVLIMIIISLAAVLIVLWFRAQLNDQAITNFDECKKLYGTVQGNNYKCQTINGDTYEIEP